MKHRKKIILTLFLFLVFFNFPINVRADNSEISSTYKDNTTFRTFNFEHFRGEKITGEGGKLRFRSQEYWVIKAEDIKLINKNTKDNKMAFLSGFSFSNNIEVETDIRAFQATPVGMRRATNSYVAGIYRHYGLDGQIKEGWDSSLVWDHYSFPELTSWNRKTNLFKGNLSFSFDIDIEVYPFIIQIDTDKFLKKENEFVSISEIILSSSRLGTSQINESTTYEDVRDEVSGAEAQSNCSGFKELWDPDIKYTKGNYTSIFKEKSRFGSNDTVYFSDGDGNKIDPLSEELRDISNCSGGFFLQISPEVFEKRGSLSWKEQQLGIKDMKIGDEIKPTVVFDNNNKRNESNPIAIKVKNTKLETSLKVMYQSYAFFSIIDRQELEGLPEQPNNYHKYIWSVLNTMPEMGDIAQGDDLPIKNILFLTLGGTSIIAAIIIYYKKFK